jgi:hypothetical protein
MPTGYCTLEDLRRALREAELPGDLSQDTQIAVDAITAQTEPLEKSLKRHWYEPTGISEATAITIPTGTQSRDDEEDIPTGGAFVVGEPAMPKTYQGSYTRIELARRDVDTIAELLVRTADGSYEDWVASNEYSGGPWPSALGQDYYLRINNGGWSHLYLETDNLLVDGEDDEYVLDSFANSVYVSYSYGHEGIPKTVRRAVAFKAASDFVQEAAVDIPDNARVYNVESLAEEFERKADELLEEYR